MKQIAKPIYQTSASYLSTPFQVQYYGLPNGKIWFIFSRFYKSELGNAGVEFVFALHKEFYFDYENETVLKPGNLLHPTAVFPELVDKPGLEYEEIKVARDINTYAEALNLLNTEASEMSNIRQIIHFAS
jgi:hypothetical protein